MSPGEVIELDDRDQIEKSLRKNTPLNIYQIGDLDDFFWPHTRWYGLKWHNEIVAIALLYAAPALPALLLLAEDSDIESAATLARNIVPQLPQQVYCHLSPGLESEFAEQYDLESRGDHFKMVLTAPNRLLLPSSSDARKLTIEHRDELAHFYLDSYPGNWFDVRMLETQHYFGIWRDQQLVSAGGVHVYSPRYGVAALGNIATRPRYRGLGLGKEVTSAICRKLLQSVSEIGLNVKANNGAAVSCYRKLGFEVVATYREIMMRRKSQVS